MTLFAQSSDQPPTDSPSVFVIAEIGVNHDGDLGRALELIDHAANSGADAVKFQCFHPDTLLSNQARFAEYQAQNATAIDTDLYALLERLRLDPDELDEAADAAGRLGLRFIVSPFSPADIPTLEQLDIDAVKIASPDAVNTPLLDAAAALRKPMIISTGACEIDELEHAAKHATDSSGALLQCVSAYPTPNDDAAIAGIAALQAAFPDVPAFGYSDHTQSELAGAIAVAAGARVLEKHLTYHHDTPSSAGKRSGGGEGGGGGPDHAASLDPKSFKTYVKRVRAAAAMLGPVKKTISDVERDVRTVSRQSVCAARDIPAGHTLSADDLTVKRPGDGIPAGTLPGLIGKTLGRAVKSGDLLPKDAELS